MSEKGASQFFFESFLKIKIKGLEGDYSRLHKGKQGREWKEWKEQKQALILREMLEQTETAQDHHQKGHLKNK